MRPKRRLTTLEEKLAEVLGLAQAAQGATEKVEGMVEDEEIVATLQQMRDEIAGRAGDRRPQPLQGGGAGRQESQISFWRYLTSSSFGQAVMENWQSEYLQFALFALATVWLLQKGSPESKELDRAGTESDREQLIGKHAREDSPRWSKYGDWRTASPTSPGSTSSAAPSRRRSDRGRDRRRGVKVRRR